MAQRCHVCGFLPQDPQALRCANCAALHETEKSQKEPDSDYRYEPVAGVPFEMKGKNLLPDDDVKIKIKGDREVRGRVDLASNKCVLYLNREGKARVQFKPDEIEWIEITALADSVLPLESRIPLRSESPRINTWIEQGAQSAFPHRYDQRNSPSAVVEFKKGMEQEMIQLFEEPVGLDCPYLYRIEPDGVLIAETGEEEIVLWKTRAPETYLGFDPRKGIIEHLRAVTERAQTLAEYTAGGQEYSVFSYASPSSMRNPRTDTKPGGAKAVYGGFRFRIRGQDQDIRPKDKDAQIAARRVSRRGLARRIAAAKKWHQSAQGSRYHRALGRYNQGELKTSPKETLENRALSNGLDLFFADMRLWALAPAINEARIADSSEILTQNTPVGAFPDGLSASPSRVVGGVEEQGAGKGAGGRESREGSLESSESHNPSLESKNLPVHVSPAENLDYTRGQFIHVGDMVGETVGEAVEAGVFSTEDKGGEIRVRYKVRGKTFASTPIDKSVYPQYANQVRMELRRAAAGFFAKGEIPADLTQIYVEEGAGDVAESYGRDTWTFKFPSKEKAEAFAEAELGDGLRLTKANEYFQDWKVEFAYYVGKTGYLVLYGVNLSDQGWGLSISKKAKKYGGETWGYGLPMGEGASVYEGKTRLFVYKAVDGKWYLEVGDGKVETFGPYDKEMTPHVVALNHAPDWEYDELSRIPSDKSGKRPVPKGARFESLGEGEEGGLDTYWELFVPMVQGVPVAKEEDIRKAVEKYPLLADRYKLNMNHGWLNIGMYAPGETGKAEKEIAKLLPVLKGVCGGRDFTVRKHQAWRSPTMPLTKFHEGLAGAKPGDRMKWTELNVGDHYALPNMSMVYKKVSPTAGALVNPDGTTRGKSVERNPSTTEVILLSLTTNHLRSGPGGAWQYEQRGYPYSAVVAEGAAPKAGDKFRLDWFTFKPGVEGKENAITFLDKGAVVVCLGSNLVPDTSMYGNPSYRFKPAEPA